MNWNGLDLDMRGKRLMVTSGFLCVVMFLCWRLSSPAQAESDQIWNKSRGASYLMAKVEIPAKEETKPDEVQTNLLRKVAPQPEQMERGRLLYMKNCFICHQLNGQGIPGAYPPLARSDFLMTDRKRSIRILCEGLSGEIVVNAKKYDGFMSVFIL